jgi:hypothetical protein
MGQFILTGSAVPDKEAEKEREHSGTGRFAWLTMRPMTLFESGESNGTVSLGDLFSTPEKILQKNELKLTDIAFLICRERYSLSSRCLHGIQISDRRQLFARRTRDILWIHQ